MQAVGKAFALLSDQEVGAIHRGALRILAEMGMEIQNHTLLQVLADFGLMVDFSTERVRFPPEIVERFLALAPPFDWEQVQPLVGGSAGIYHGRFHDPETGELLEWNEDRLAYYFAMARELPKIDKASMLGCRLPGKGVLEPLYERLINWKYGGEEGSSIYGDDLCPYLLELYQMRAAALDKPIDQVFRGTVYLIPGLKLGRHEAYQVAYFRERGLRVGIGGMFAMGASAPVTLAGAVTLNLAEQIALRILDWAWFGRLHWALGGSISVMDMRTMIYPYGRPEMALANLMIAQMARFYRASYSGHAGLTDAKLPSVEAGYQKALTAIPTLMAGGNLWMDAGLLSIDEVCSPVQLVLDHEFLSALEHFARPFQVDDEAIGLDEILRVGPGGHYLDSEHTVRYLRAGEHWQPKIWSREMLNPWLVGSRMLDADKAREFCLQVKRKDYRQPHISAEFERAILSVIAQARIGLAA